MVQINLKRLIKKELSPVLTALVQAMDISISIYDTAETCIMGEKVSLALERHPIVVSGETLGWVRSTSKAADLAQIISTLAEQSIEKKALANEVLDRYREVNLLYTVAEKLTTCREVTAVAQLALEEAQRLVSATGAFLMLLDADKHHLNMILHLGSQHPYGSVVEVGQGIIGYVAQTGKSEIVNDVNHDPRHQGHELMMQSLICAPLKAQDRVMGVISIFHADQVDYSAADLKLLTAIALQSTPAIEAALFHETEMASARQREEKLRAQLNELRIEIDEAKRARQVAEITETDFFQTLQQKAKLQRQRQTDQRSPRPPRNGE